MQLPHGVKFRWLTLTNVESGHQLIGVDEAGGCNISAQRILRSTKAQVTFFRSRMSAVENCSATNMKNQIKQMWENI